MRLGIFGGTFDPPHIGHLLVGSDAVEALALDRLVFVPNAVQPLKGAGIASATQRFEMVRLLIGDDARFSVDPIEIERQGVSYTVETLATYANDYPAAERFLLIGADVVPTFGQWHQSGRIPTLAHVVVLRRSGEPDGAQEPAAGSRSFRWLDTRSIAISSSEVRARLRHGLSIHGFVPDAVAAYIGTAALYRD